MSAGTPEYTRSSGNVFADLGLPDSDELLAKAALAGQIASIIRHRHLTQVEAACVLGTGQPKISELLAGKLDGFSIERLIRYLNSLGRDVQILVTPKPRRRERATVQVIGRARAVRSGRAARAGWPEGEEPS
jgi:predicted XRE-type DNA-binding protein